MASACRKGKLAICQAALKCSPTLSKRSVQQILALVFGVDLGLCPACQSSHIVTLPIEQQKEWTGSFLQLGSARPPPERITIRVATPVF